MIRRVVAAVFVAGAVLTGCSSTPEPTPPSPEQVACQAWADAFNDPNAGKVTGALVGSVSSAAEIAPSTSAGQLMNVFIVRQALPGAHPESTSDLVAVQTRCAAVGVVFDYPA